MDNGQPVSQTGCLFLWKVQMAQMPLTRLPFRASRRTISLLGGFCFFLSALEYMVPKPLPFIRIGLANLPLLLALDIMPLSSCLILAGLKIAGQSLISGTLFSYVFLFSLGGTGASVLLMFVLRRGLGKERISLVGVSTAGAMASNGVQLILAYYFIFGESIRYAAVPILALGLVTGTLLGMGAEYYINRSRWYAGILDLWNNDPDVKDLRNNESQVDTASRTEEAKPHKMDHIPSRLSKPAKRFFGGENFRKVRESFCNRAFASSELAAAGLCMMPALLLNPDTNARIIQFLFFWALAWLSGKKNNPFITVSVIMGIVFFNLLVPYGEVSLSFGPLKITSGALQAGIHRAVTLQGLFMLSRSCIRRDLKFPGAFGEITGESFRIFSNLGEDFSLLGKDFYKKGMGKNLFKELVEHLDRLLFNYSGGDLLSGNSGPAEKNRSAPPACEKKEPEDSVTSSGLSRLRGRITLVAIVILAWLPVFIF